MVNFPSSDVSFLSKFSGTLMGCVHHNIKLQWGHHVLCRYGGRPEFLLQAGHCNHCWARRANWKCGLLIDWMEEGLMCFFLDLYFADFLIILICWFLLVIIFESLLLFFSSPSCCFFVSLLLLLVDVAKVNIDIDVHWLSLYFNLGCAVFGRNSWFCLGSIFTKYQGFFQPTFITISWHFSA